MSCCHVHSQLHSGAGLVEFKPGSLRPDSASIRVAHSKVLELGASTWTLGIAHLHLEVASSLSVAKTHPAHSTIVDALLVVDDARPAVQMLDAPAPLLV